MGRDQHRVSEGKEVHRHERSKGGFGCQFVGRSDEPVEAGTAAVGTRLFGETVFPVCPTCAEYGYQPASTTARVAATAPPSALASSSTAAKPSGPPRPRPPATITSASSIDGPLVSSWACSTIRAAVEKSCSVSATS